MSSSIDYLPSDDAYIFSVDPGGSYLPSERPAHRLSRRISRNFFHELIHLLLHQKLLLRRKKKAFENLINGLAPFYDIDLYREKIEEEARQAPRDYRRLVLHQKKCVSVGNTCLARIDSLKDTGILKI